MDIWRKIRYDTVLSMRRALNTCKLLSNLYNLQSKLFLQNFDSDVLLSVSANQIYRAEEGGGGFKAETVDRPQNKSTEGSSIDWWRVPDEGHCRVLLLLLLAKQVRVICCEWIWSGSHVLGLSLRTGVRVGVDQEAKQVVCVEKMWLIVLILLILVLLLLWPRPITRGTSRKAWTILDEIVEWAKLQKHIYMVVHMETYNISANYLQRRESEIRRASTISLAYNANFIY